MTLSDRDPRNHTGIKHDSSLPLRAGVTKRCGLGAGVRLGGDRFGSVLCGPDPRFWMGRSYHHKVQRGHRGGSRGEQEHLCPGSVSPRRLSPKVGGLLEEEKKRGDKDLMGALGLPSRLTRSWTPGGLDPPPG